MEVVIIASLRGLEAKGGPRVADAVNASVVPGFIAVFVTNLLTTQIHRCSSRVRWADPMTHPSTHTADHAVTCQPVVVDQCLRHGQGIGRWILFTVQTIVHLPYTVRHYRKQTTKTMEQHGLARGLPSSSVAPSRPGHPGVAIGVAVAIEAYNTLNLIGFGPLTGVIGAFLNIREMGPIMTGIGFAAQVGCRMTAEIGSMRIAEEIDATENPWYPVHSVRRRDPSGRRHAVRHSGLPAESGHRLP